MIIFNSSIIVVYSFFESVPPPLAAGGSVRPYGPRLQRLALSGALRYAFRFKRRHEVPPALVLLSSRAKRGQLCDVRKSRLSLAHTRIRCEKNKPSLGHSLSPQKEPLSRLWQRSAVLKTPS
ncbi:hypothetical protein ROHU_031192 [Labeo rohita]|uniref:Uncharacterized protein n=1 Tax=Labeo rohita TaxID=84645 RepID=A0A498LLS4_LABRO|nr:hypothetical protein ROHU_031462 [Labeo rohita]RXN09812.1 hypothetical protein ROHU_031192 [Labeo rohita]